MCRTVGDKKYSVVNSSIECYDTTYLTTVLPIYGSILALLLVMFPMLLFYHLHKNRKILNRIII